MYRYIGEIGEKGGAMEWTTVQHLDLRHVGRGLKPLQPHAATFHPHQALVAVAIGSYIIGENFLRRVSILCRELEDRCSLVESVEN